MSDINISGIPNYGFGGGSVFGGNAATGQPAYSANDINNSMGWDPNAPQFDPWGNTPGGFGAQTDYYSALGAAYGRQTGGFGGGGWSGEGPKPVSAWDSADWARYNQIYGGGGGAPPVQDYGGGASPGGFSPSPNYPGGSAPAADAGPKPVSAWDSADWARYNSIYGGGGGGQPQMQQPSSMKLLGYDPAMSSMFAPGGNDFANRFGQWGSNAGTPSQYYTGTEYGGGGGTPPGFSGTYGVDSPNGALNLWGTGNPGQPGG